MWNLQLEGDPRFPMGRIMISTCVLDLFSEDENRDAILAPLLARHLTGDWGEEIGEDLAKSNERSVRKGGQIISVYTISGQKVIITTDERREETRILLAAEIEDL